MMFHWDDAFFVFVGYFLGMAMGFGVCRTVKSRRKNRARTAIGVLVWLLAQAIPHHALATDYYVNPTTGNDANNGAIGTPWKHICYAIGGGGWIVVNVPVLMAVDRTACPTTNPTNLVAGDTLYLRGGTYQEHFIIISSTENSGTAGNPITVTGYPGEAVILDGGFRHGCTSPDLPPGGSELCTGAMPNVKALFWINNGRSYWTIKGSVAGGSLFLMQGGVTSGVYIGDSGSYTNKILIENVEIKDIHIGDNTGAIYLGGSHGGVEIRYSKLHPETQATTRGSCVEGFNGLNDTVFEHNECYNAVEGWWHKHGSSLTPGSLVRNNVFHDLTGVGLYTKASLTTFEHNLVYNVGTGAAVGNTSDCATAYNNGNKFFHNTFVDTTTGIRISGQHNSCLADPHYDIGFDTVIRDNLIVNFANGEYRGLGLRYSPEVWQAGENELLKERVRPTTPNGYKYVVTTAGVTGTTQPTWCTTPACTVADGTVTWTLDDVLDTSRTTVEYTLAYSAAVTSEIIMQDGATYDWLSMPSTILGRTGNLSAAPVFVNYAGKNFALQAGSPGKSAASDGTDMGARICDAGITSTCTPSLLVVAPTSTAIPPIFLGARGGKFTPSATSFTIYNSGVTAVDWTASSNQTWAVLSSSGGNLASNTSVVVTVTATPLSTALTGGVGTATITITNTTDGGGNTTRTVKLAAQGRGHGGVR